MSLTEQRIGVIGANGSGKSTLLRLLNGLVAPSRGTVTVNGADTVRKVRAVRQQVGFVFTDPLSQLVMPTGREDVELSLRRSVRNGEGTPGRPPPHLDRFGLLPLADQSIYELSGGERQLLALAAVLAVEPAVLVLDEPSTLLDLRNRELLRRTIAGLSQQIVMSTHDLELALDMDRVLVVESGRIVFDGGAAAAVDALPRAVRRRPPADAAPRPRRTSGVRGEGPRLPARQLRAGHVTDPPHAALAEVPAGGGLRHGVVPDRRLAVAAAALALMCVAVPAQRCGAGPPVPRGPAPASRAAGHRAVPVVATGRPVAARIVLNILLCVVAASLLTATTPLQRLLDGVVSLARPFRRFGADPERFALTIAIMLRSIPFIAGAFSDVRDSARARGLERNPRALVLPVFITTVAYARQTGEALAARGLGDPEDRRPGDALTRAMLARRPSLGAVSLEPGVPEQGGRAHAAGDADHGQCQRCPAPAVRRAWASSLVTSTAPDAPYAWPRASAPPSGLARSGSMPRLSRHARVWEANASLNSTRSTVRGRHALLWPAAARPLRRPRCPEAAAQLLPCRFPEPGGRLRRPVRGHAAGT